MVGHALKICEQVIEHKADGQRTRPGLQALDMAELELVAQHVDMLLQRLYPVGLLQILFDEGVDGQRQDLVDRAEQHVHLMLAVCGKADLLFKLLARHLADVHGVVADALKVAEGVEVLGHALVLLVIELRAVELHEVSADLVLIAVDEILVLLDLLCARLGELMEQEHGVLYVLARLSRHGVDGHPALLDGEGRVLEEAFVQSVEVGAGLALLAALGDEADEQLFDRAEAGQQHDRADHAVDRIDHGDAHGAHDHGLEREVRGGVREVVDRAAEDRAEDRADEIGPGCALAAGLRAEGGQQHGHRRADADAEEDGIGLDKTDRAGHGQGLQNTDGGRGALQHGGEGRAREDAEDGIGESGHKADKGRAVL